MDVALFDYGTGNLHSLGKALEHGGARVRIEADMARALAADAVVLPGVGAFAAAAQGLAGAGPAPGGEAPGGLMVELVDRMSGGGGALLKEAVAEGKPCLGICLGMQLLFEESEEGAGHGVGALPGRVRRVQARRVPHMGWNSVEASDDPIFEGVTPLVAYYANSFVVDPDVASDVIAWTSYGADRFPAAVRRERTWGVQFHPEKSGPAGLRLVANFLRQAAAP